MKLKSTMTAIAVMMALAAVTIFQGVIAPTAGAQTSEGIILQAQARDGANEPMQGVIVIASLVPTETPLKQSVEGEVLNRHLVGQSITAKNGAFSIRQDRESIPPQYVAADGSIDVRLTFARPGQTGNDQAQWLGGYAATIYPPKNDSGPWRASPLEEADDAGTKAQPIELSFAMGAKGMLLHDESPEGNVKLVEALAEAPVPNNYSGENGELQENQTTSCSETWKANYHNVPIVMLSAGSNSAWMQYDYEFAANDSQTMGVAYSGSGAFGSFGASGTKTTSSSVTINWPPRTASSGSDHIYYRSQAKYSKYREDCHFIAGGSWFTTTTYEVRPRFIEGDQIWTGQSNTYPTHCVTVLPNGGSITRQSGTSTSYTNAVDISSNIGIDLKLKNTLAGGTSHKITFENIGSSGTRYVCGQYAQIGSSGYTGTLMGDWKDR